MTDLPATEPDDGVPAAEYVLGLLSRDERQAFERRLAQDPGLLAEVRMWQAQFAGLAEAEVEAVAPPPRVLAAVEARIFGAGPAAAAPAGLWDRIAFWRGLSLASSALAAAVVVLAVLPDSGPPSLPETPETPGIPEGRLLMTHLIPTEGSALGLAVTREPSGVLQVLRVAGDMEPGRAREVWLIVGDAAPVSLGLLGEDPLTILTPDAEVSALFETGAVLAISDEPPGGAPGGAPTGAILAVGSLVAL